jgi:hypothetical protein
MFPPIPELFGNITADADGLTSTPARSRAASIVISPICGIEESGTEKGSFHDTACGKAD